MAAWGRMFNEMRESVSPPGGPAPRPFEICQNDPPAGLEDAFHLVQYPGSVPRILVVEGEREDDPSEDGIPERQPDGVSTDKRNGRGTGNGITCHSQVVIEPDEDFSAFEEKTGLAPRAGTDIETGEEILAKEDFSYPSPDSLDEDPDSRIVYPTGNIAEAFSS